MSAQEQTTTGADDTDATASFLDALARPLAAAPMAGGPTTPALVAAAEAAGGIGFLSAGYQSVDSMAADIRAVREGGTELFGVNLFITDHDDARRATTDEAIAAYRERLTGIAGEAGLPGPGSPRFTDNDIAGKIEHLVRHPVPVVSFTFGTPGPADLERLRDAGSQTAVMVTSAADAHAAVSDGADVLIAQGTEAGGHQSTFSISAEPGRASTTALVAELRREHPEIPLLAAGGIHTAEALRAVLDAGADAALLGTALLCTVEAGTNDAFRHGLRTHVADPGSAPTVFTRAMSGRPARAVENTLTAAAEDAPAAYPYNNEMTKPLRAAAAKLPAAQGAEYTALWSGESLAGMRPSPDLFAEGRTLADVFDAIDPRE